MGRNPAKSKQSMRDILKEEMAADESTFQEKPTKSTKNQQDTFNSKYQEFKENSMEFLEREGEKLAKLEETLKEYADELFKNMKKNPITTLLIAGGVGFLLAAIFKKHDHD